MLLRFGFSNFLSVRCYQDLNLAASNLRDSPSYLLSEDGLPATAPIIGIYGANASGKTNVLLALRYMIGSILHSQTTRGPEADTGRDAFRLDENSISNNSQFDIDFSLDRIRYHYGFTVTDKTVSEEWLYAFPRGRRQIWFYRRGGRENIEFGSFLQGKNRNIEALTRSNSLFLSAAAQNNHDQLMPIFSYFRDNFVFRMDTRADFVDFMSKLITDRPEIKSQIVRYLANADVGINGIDIKTVEVPDHMRRVFSGVVKLINEQIFVDSDTKMDELPGEQQRIQLQHRSNTGANILFDLPKESRGTRELLSLLGPIFECLARGGVLIVDELDSSLHPLLAANLLELFAGAASNPHRAQLLFTTHDANLLSAGALRRDEIWFTEKDREGATHVYPLTDIKTRNTDNIQKGYLEGRYGGIPYVGDLSRLFSLAG